MIAVSGVSMRYGSKVLFDEVSTTFSPGRRYGLTGPNGAGKSTFMKLLTGELTPQRGTVSRPEKFGVLSQDQYAFDAFRVTPAIGSKCFSGIKVHRYISGDPIYEPTFGRKRRA